MKAILCAIVLMASFSIASEEYLLGAELYCETDPLLNDQTACEASSCCHWNADEPGEGSGGAPGEVGPGRCWSDIGPAPCVDAMSDCNSDEDCTEATEICLSMGKCLDLANPLTKEWCDYMDCGENDGDCDRDYQCQDSTGEKVLTCGRNNADSAHSKLSGVEQFKKTDFCMEAPTCQADTDCAVVSSKHYCASDGFCRYKSGSCNRSELFACGLNDGDCDSDLDCIGEEGGNLLICGQNNLAALHPDINAKSKDDACIATTNCETDQDCVDNMGDSYWCASDSMCHSGPGYCDEGGCQENEGDCDSDWNCVGDLICGTSNFKAAHPLVLGAKDTLDACIQGSTCESDPDCSVISPNHFCANDGNCHRANDYCTKGRELNSDFICQLGEGDCDDDEDCAEGLVCGDDGSWAAMHPDIVGANMKFDACISEDSMRRLRNTRAAQTTFLHDNSPLHNPWFWGFIFNLIVLTFGIVYNLTRNSKQANFDDILLEQEKQMQI